MIREDLSKALARNPEILRRFIESIPGDRIFRKRGPGAWTIYQHVRHLAEVQDMAVGRLRLFFQDPRPPIVPYSPEKETDRQEDTSIPVSELLDSFARLRMRQLEVISEATAEIWKRSIEHPEYDFYTFEIFVRHLYNHDGFHLYRIEELWLLRDGYLSVL